MKMITLKKLDPETGRPLPDKNPSLQDQQDPMKQYAKLYREAHNFHARHSRPDSSPAFWEEASSDLAAVAGRYDNDPFLCDLLQAVYMELQRKIPEE